MNGHVRPLEPVHEMAILQIDPEELGRVKEGPAKRYLAGKEKYQISRSILTRLTRQGKRFGIKSLPKLIIEWRKNEPVRSDPVSFIASSSLSK
jgi:hypothetical protein